MEPIKSYCQFVSLLDAKTTNPNKYYHDFQYGFPIDDDNELFGRLILEINQAGLSWTTILNKQDGFRKAYHQFNIKKVASYGEKDINRLLNDASIIRNRLKINAAIENAKTILNLSKEFGDFQGWLMHHHPLSREEWTRLFKKTFKFTGGEIVNEFLVSTGYLEGAHHPGCPVHKKVLKSKPVWSQKPAKKRISPNKK